MVQDFLCPHCQNPLAYSPQDLGKTLLCPYCSQTFTLAQPSLPDGSTPPTAAYDPEYHPPHRRAVPLHRPPRPPGVTIIAVVGMVISSFLMITGLPVLLPLLFLIDPQIAEKIDSYLPKNLEWKHLQIFFGILLLLGFLLLINFIAFRKGSKTAKLFVNLIAILMVVAATAALTRLFLDGDIRSHLVILACYVFCLLFFLTAFIYLQSRRVLAWFH